METKTQTKKQPKAVLGGVDYIPITSRGITLKTAKLYDYGVCEVDGQKCQVAAYKNKEGKTTGQKLRFQGKKFMSRGQMSEAPLYGQSLFNGKGKRIYVTEGEIDAMTLYQVLGSSWPVVSLPNGADLSGKKAAEVFRREIEFLEGYDEVCIVFDNDTAGRESAVEAAKVLSPGKAIIVTLTGKDANEMFMNGETEALARQVRFNGKEYKPEVIVRGTDTLPMVLEKIAPGIPFPFECLNEKTFGILPKKLITITAGTGVGKTLFVSQIALDLFLRHNQKVGYIAFEQSVDESAKILLSTHMGKDLLDPKVRGELDDAVITQAWEETLGKGGIEFVDYFGSMDAAELITTIRYMVVALGCKYIILDHISMVVSGSGVGTDERQVLDNVMTDLRKFVEETEITLFVVSHLRRPEGKKGFEDGLKVSLNHLRGSQGLAQLSDMVIALERNMNAAEQKADVSNIRILKNRRGGRVGLCGKIKYNPLTTQLSDCYDDFDPAEESDF